MIQSGHLVFQDGRHAHIIYLITKNLDVIRFIFHRETCMTQFSVAFSTVHNRSAILFFQNGRHLGVFLLKTPVLNVARRSF